MATPKKPSVDRELIDVIARLMDKYKPKVPEANYLADEIIKQIKSPRPSGSANPYGDWMTEKIVDSKGPRPKGVPSSNPYENWMTEKLVDSKGPRPKGVPEISQLEKWILENVKKGGGGSGKHYDVIKRPGDSLSEIGRGMEGVPPEEKWRTRASMELLKALARYNPGMAIGMGGSGGIPPRPRDEWAESLRGQPLSGALPPTSTEFFEGGADQGGMGRYLAALLGNEGGPVR